MCVCRLLQYSCIQYRYSRKNAKKSISTLTRSFNNPTRIQVNDTIYYPIKISRIPSDNRYQGHKTIYFFKNKIIVDFQNDVEYLYSVSKRKYPIS
ncbi:hypothetical protein QTP88_008647 [Uroleucon formosanum]